MTSFHNGPLYLGLHAWKTGQVTLRSLLSITDKLMRQGMLCRENVTFHSRGSLVVFSRINWGLIEELA